MAPRPHPITPRSSGLGRAGLAATAIALLPFVSCLSRAADPQASRQQESESEPAAPAEVAIAPVSSVVRPGDEIDLSRLKEADRGSWPVAEPSDDLDAPIDPERALASIAKETFVFAEPSWRAKKIGYLRAGAIVRRSREPTGRAGCADGWYSIEPEGYVCVGKSATLELEHPIVKLSARRPNTEAPLPYLYGKSTYPTPPFYAKIPSAEEQRRVEVELDKHLSQKPGKSWDAVGLEPIPEPLEGSRLVPLWNGKPRSEQTLYTGRGMVQSGFALLSVFESDGRRFGLTVDLDVVPLDRMTRVEPSTFHGLELDHETTLPVVFIRSRAAVLYEGSPTTGLKPGRTLGFREALPITGKRVRIGGVAYLETPSGGFIRDEHLTRVNPMKQRPGWAVPGRTWIEVSILEQSLVAYEGDKPVYVTLVSTGADGLGDPEETHSTVRGQFLIHTKHLTATMSGDEIGDEFDLRDVPYVQYFNEGYALHAAYWHDSFGRPRSHGCINLSPIDARWLFHWTDPPLPEGWHGVMSLREGTLVHVHP